MSQSLLIGKTTCLFLCACVVILPSGQLVVMGIGEKDPWIGMHGGSFVFGHLGEIHRLTWVNKPENQGFTSFIA